MWFLGSVKQWVFILSFLADLHHPFPCRSVLTESYFHFNEVLRKRNSVLSLCPYWKLVALSLLKVTSISLTCYQWGIPSGRSVVTESYFSFTYVLPMSNSLWSFCPYWKLLRFHLRASNDFTCVLPLCYFKNILDLLPLASSDSWCRVCSSFFFSFSSPPVLFFLSFFKLFQRCGNYFLVSCKFPSFFFRLNFSFTWLAALCSSLYFVCCCCLRSPCFSWPPSSDIAVLCFCPFAQVGKASYRMAVALFQCCLSLLYLA